MEENLQRLLKSYSNARRSWESWCFMVNIDVKTVRFDIARHIKNDKFLSHYLYLSLKDYYIEMYKILKVSKNNKDNIFRLLNSFIETNPEKNGQAKSSIEELNKIQPTIKKMCDIRDKFYAHLDKDYKDYIYKGIAVGEDTQCFIVVETAIIALTSRETLQSFLDEIPSRDEFKLELSSA